MVIKRDSKTGKYYVAPSPPSFYESKRHSPSKSSGGGATIKPGEGVYQDIATGEVKVRRGDDFVTVTQPIEVVRGGRTGGGGRRSSGLPPIQTKQVTVSRAEKQRQEQQKLLQERKERGIKGFEERGNGGMTAQEFQESLIQQSRADLTPTQQDIQQRFFQGEKPPIETKNERIIRNLRDKNTYSTGGKTYFTAPDGSIQSVKGGEDKVARWVERRIFGADPSLNPIKNFKYGEDLSLRYAHMYLGKRLGDWWINELKKEGRLKEGSFLEKPAPAIVTETVAELPTFAAFAPFMETGTAQQTESVYTEVKGRFVKKSDLDDYLMRANVERAGKVVKIKDLTYTEKANRVKALLEMAKRSNNPKDKLAVLNSIKNNYGTSFLKDFASQEMGIIYVPKGTSGATKAVIPDEVVQNFFTRYNIPVVPKMRGVAFIEAPVTGAGRFSAFESPTNLFEEPRTQPKPRERSATESIVESLTGSIQPPRTDQRPRSRTRQAPRVRQQPRTATDVMTDMLTDTMQKPRQEFRRPQPRKTGIPAPQQRVPRFVLFDLPERRKPTKKKTIKKTKGKKKPRKYVATITGFEAALGLGPRYVEQRAFTGFEAVRGRAVRKPSRRKAPKKRKQTKRVSRRDELSRFLY